MNTIRVYTIEGCVACKILVDTVQKALKAVVEDNVQLDVISHDTMGRTPFFKDNNITDFPTIVFMQDDVVKHIHTGTLPKYKVLKHIHDCFKHE